MAETINDLLRRYIDDETYSFQGMKSLGVNTVGLELETPLHVAVTREALIDVMLLLLHGANVNAATNVGSTPLHRAVLGENIEIVEALVLRGADQGLKNFWGETPRDVLNKRPFSTVKTGMLDALQSTPG